MNLSRQQLTELRVAFNIFDVDHSGDISKQEYNNVICKLGFGPHINEYMKLFGDENHKMDFEEFKLKMHDLLYPEHQSIKDINDAFKYFDINNSGMISLNEFDLVLKKFSDFSKDSIENIMDKVDKDHNKLISIDEFKKLLSE